MKYIYGPVKSRRLGLSLGISLTQHKICNFDCVYCQLGPTKEVTLERKEYLKPEEVLSEFKSWVENNPDDAKGLKYVTFSGMGEPTLNSKIGQVIDEVKKITGARIAVITNASLLNNPDARGAILGVDLIVPSLDAVDQKIFVKIDRPGPGIKVEDIINGLILLRKEFRGEIWLEIMLVKGLNDGPKHVKALKEAIDKISPDRIQLNSPVRSTSEKDILALGRKELEAIKNIFGNKCEIV
ncbi:MAG: radical SAM protein [Candidatus Omnitrophota bacterium]